MKQSRFIVAGVNPFALALSVALLYGSAPVGFNWMFLSSKEGVEKAIQRLKPRPGPFTDARRPVWLGTDPGRDPIGRAGTWTPRLLNDLQKVLIKERYQRPDMVWASIDFLGLIVSPPPPEGGGGGGGGGEGGGEGGGGSQLNTNTGNRLTPKGITGWSSAGDSRVSFNLYHNSMGTYNFDIGEGWSHSYDVKVDYTQGMSAIVRWGDGTRHPYTEDINGDFTPTAGVHDSLVKNGNGTFTLTTKYQSVLEFNTSGRLTSVEDKFGNAVTVSRDGNQKVTAVTDEDSRALEFAYNGSGLIESVTDPLDRVWEFAYNGSLQLTGITYPDLDTVSHDRTFTYDTGHNILTETDLEGNVWTWTYDSGDRETSYTDPLEKTWTFAYTDTAVTMTDPLANEVVHNYSGGLLASTVDEAEYSDAFEWSLDKQLSEYTDRRGKVWLFSHDADGNLVVRTDPLNRTWEYTYNANNFLTSVEDPLANVTTVAYAGGSMAPTSITDPLSRTAATLTYDGDGDLLSVEDALERTTTYEYDGYKNVVEVTAPDGTIVSGTYNLIGWVESVTDSAADETLVEYDEWGRTVAIEHSDESVVSLVYNLEGLIVSATDELSRTGYRVYNDRYDLTATENARGDDHAFAYNDAGWLTSVTNGRNYARDYAYTVRGEVYTLTLADESVESWAYNANGQTSSYTNALSQTIGYAYNDAGDLTTVDYPTGTDTSFTYDGAGRTVSMTDATGTSSWTFNAAGEVTALDTPQGDLDYVYDLSGAVTEMTVDGTATTEYDYDAYGRFSSLTNQFSETTSVTYDSAGRVSRKDFDSGVYEAFTYDDRSRPTLVLVKNSGNTEIDRKEYVWDDASRVTSAKEGGYWSYYEYDSIDQLVEEEKPALSYLATYTYDANGNRATRTVNSVTETYAYDEADKLETVTVNNNVVKEFTYDAAGRTTAIETSAGMTSFAYDYEGRVTSITYPSTSSDTFGYNGLDARVSAQGASGNFTYARAGQFITSALLSDGVSSYTPGFSVRSSGTTKFEHSGLKNSSTQSNSSESVSASQVYDAFGNIVSSSGSWSGALGYGGDFGYQRDASGLHLLGARYYDSTIGRFVTQDPVRDGANWYVYAASNPITGCDPTGLFLDALLDIAGMAWDIYDIIKDPGNPGGYVNLVWSTASVFVPGVPGSYASKLTKLATKRALKAVEATADVTKGVAKLTPAQLVANNRAKGLRAEDEYAALLDSIGMKYDRRKAVPTGLGIRYPDFLLYGDPTDLSKVTKHVEVKSGNAFYGGSQAAKDEFIKRVFEISTEVVRMP